MASGFKINTAGIEKMTREIQAEFNKHPISLPIHADSPKRSDAAGDVYYGPVVFVNGDHAQVAWENGVAHQSQSETRVVTEGYEALATAVASVLEGIGNVGLNPEDTQAARHAGESVLREITKPSPVSTVIHAGVTALKGALASVALGLGSGVAAATQEWATTAVAQLMHATG